NIVQAAKQNPNELVNYLVDILKSQKDEELKMAGKNNNMSKEAYHKNPPPVEEVQEGQLDNLDGNFSRKNDPSYASDQVGVTTERQLDKIPKSKETGKGDWN